MTIKIKIAPGKTCMKGFYRECTEALCDNLVPCPFVKCREHWTGFNTGDYSVISFKKEEVEIIL